MLNKIQIIGRLGNDPEKKDVNGKTVANFSVATSEKYKDNQGNQVETTEWFRCQAWDKLGDICAQYLTKGSLVYVEGKLKTRKWQDKDGVDKYSTDLIVKEMKMLSSKTDNQNEAQGYQKDPAQSQQVSQRHRDELPNFATGDNLPPRFDADQSLPF